MVSVKGTLVALGRAEVGDYSSIVRVTIPDTLMR